jgi:hypothetical protein
MKSRKMRLIRHIVRMWYACKRLVGNPLRMRKFGTLRRGWEINVKINLRNNVREWTQMNWFSLVK